MRYQVLATDYDGTIAHDGVVDQPTVDALVRAREGGLRLIMVTGRELSDLFNTFAHSELFDRIVAENGAVLYDPATAVAVANALPSVKEMAHYVTKGARGAGVAELIDRALVGELDGLGQETTAGLRRRDG